MAKSSEKILDFSYFQHDIGHYIPGLFDQKENFKPYEPVKDKLVWYVIGTTGCRGYNYCVRPINLFEYNWVFLRDGLLYAKEHYSHNFKKFADHIRRWLSHEYWARSQYEVLIIGSSMPPTINREDLKRYEEEMNKPGYDDKPYGYTYIDDSHMYKLDVYTQVMLNWDRFIDYIWKNKDLITVEKLGLEHCL